MSDQSWLDEFYPTEVKDVKKADASQHSLTKWIGLRAENLMAHEIQEPPISVSSDTCALCRHYLDEWEHSSSCANCPIYIHFGLACDSPGWSEGCLTMHESSPYISWTSFNNPEPMIVVLNALLGLEGKRKGD